MKVRFLLFEPCCEKTCGVLTQTRLDGHRRWLDHTCDIILDANREIWALKSYFVL